MKIWIIGFLVGIVSGTVAALCGVGGGILMVPAFAMLLGVAQKTAVATSLAVIVPTSLVATILNWKNGLVNKPVFCATALGTAVFFTEKLKHFRDETLTRIFGVVVIVMGVLMLFMPVKNGASAAPQGDSPSGAGTQESR
jgi:uncharacterized membrane protein YfcA